LKIELSPRDDHQVKITAEFEPEVLEQYKQKAARKISKEAKIPGFRPGKAPYAVIHRFYGNDMIEKEANELILEEKYQDILKEAKIESFANGTLEEIVSINPPKFVFVVPLMPEVTLGDYRSIRKPYQLPEITEDRIEQVVKNLRAGYATAEPVQRPVEEGDLVSFSLEGTLALPEEGQDSSVFNNPSLQMIVGENDFEVDDYPYEGFTRELVGLSEEEEKSFSYTFPDDEKEEKARGKEVNFKVKVQSIKALTMPALDDEFAQSVGDYENVEGLRKSILLSLVENDQKEYDKKYLSDIVDEIRSTSTIQFPPQALSEEADRVLHSIEHNLADQKMDLPAYLKTINLDKEAFIEKEVNPVARQRLERSLILDEVAKSESITLDLNLLQKEAEFTMQQLQSDPEFAKQARGRNSDTIARNVTMEAANRVMNRQIIARLKAIANDEADPIEVSPEPEAEAPASTLAQEEQTEIKPAE
jgi:trigger factor